MYGGADAEMLSDHASKGSNVMIEGRLKLKKWEKDGTSFSKLEVISEKAQLVKTPQATYNDTMYE